MSVRPVFAWYDAWVGFFWDRAKRTLYFFPLPCVGLRIQFPRRPKTMSECWDRLYAEGRLDLSAFAAVDKAETE